MLFVLSGIVLLASACSQETQVPTPTPDSLPTDTAAIDSPPTPDTGPEDPAIGYATPQYCGTCHPTHYEQWRGSMHAYAIKDPVFEAMLAKGIEDTQGKLDQFCVQCHAPVASLKGLMPVIESEGVFRLPVDHNNPLVSHGVQCVTCHSIETVHGTQNAQFTLSETTYFGPTGSAAANSAHPVEKSPFFSDPSQSSLLCGACHDVLNPNGARLEATFSEWYSNAFNAPSNPEQHRTCGDCHMPTYQGSVAEDSPTTTVHSHHFIGVDQALIADFPGKEEQAALVRALLEDCAELDVEYNGVEEGHAVFVITVKNINNGHNLPSGSTADRQVWVHLQIRNEEGQLVYESGMLDANGDLMDGVQGHSLDPAGDPELLAFGQFIYDGDGNHVLFPWEAVDYTDNLIGPGQKAWRDYPVPATGLAGQTLHLTATLRYRTFPPFLIRTLIQEGYLAPDALAPIPIIDMESETFSVTVLP